MPHRGRLNILNNILRKPAEKLFAEFMGERYDENIALGDVKYHLGYDNKITTDKGKEVFLSMSSIRRPSGHIQRQKTLPKIIPVMAPGTSNHQKDMW